MNQSCRKSERKDTALQTIRGMAASTGFRRQQPRTQETIEYYHKRHGLSSWFWDDAI
jgi:hypothetical protein